MVIVLTHRITRETRRKWFLTERAAWVWAEWQYPTAFGACPLWLISFEED